MSKQFRLKSRNSGFTLIELIVVIGIFVVAGVFIVGGFNQGIKALASSRAKISASAIANEKLEIIRNMPFNDVGTTTGWPHGEIPSTETIVRNNFEFIVQTRVDYIDDPFDGNAGGTIPGKPIDTVPNDYKKAEVSVKWNRTYANPVLLSTMVVPKQLESAENTGSMLIQVFNSSGHPVPQAVIHIINNQVIPAIDINNTTDNDGNLQVLSLPPSIEGYQIEVTKDGYSTDATYAVDPITLPHPVKTDVSIIVEEVTEVSFSIDLVSTLNIYTVNDTCEPIPNVPLSIWGEKLIGTNPDTLKYSSEPPTNESGSLSLSSLEWDNYTLLETSADYDVAGVIPPVVLSILPDTTQNTSLVLTPHTTNSLRVTVKDSGTETALTGASVRLTKTGYDETKLTGFGFFEQNDWSGGSGQELFSNATKYFEDDGNIDTQSTPGNISLDYSENEENYFEDFITDNYKDATVTTADWNTTLGQITLEKQGENYLSSGTAQSIKINSGQGKVTKATLSAVETLNNQTINYFLSADGGTNFEPIIPGTVHLFVSVGDDLKFRVELTTNDPSQTPILDNVTINYTQIVHASNGSLTSSTFNTGNISNFGTLTWLPSSQPPESGTGSVRLQIATNNDGASWNFIGPDGTSGTYYTSSGSAINGSHNDNQYIRYKVYLSTADQAFTPVLSDNKVGYTSSCIPPGQVFFSDLNNDNYAIDITLDGYEPLSTSVSVSGTTQAEYFLTPL